MAPAWELRRGGVSYSGSWAYGPGSPSPRLCPVTECSCHLSVRAGGTVGGPEELGLPVSLGSPSRSRWGLTPSTPPPLGGVLCVQNDTERNSGWLLQPRGL